MAAALASADAHAAQHGDQPHTGDAVLGGKEHRAGHGRHMSMEAVDSAPIGLMGDHLMHKGRFALSFRSMRMSMEGNRIGTDEATPEEIVTTVPNRFFGAPMQPPTLRVVPTEMDMDMLMIGAIYAPTDWLTLMAMANIVRKEMDHITFQGPMGTNRLGTFTTASSGFGDTRLAGLVRLLRSETGGVSHNAHLNLGLSLPTGSITETDRILTPTGATPSPRLPYPMQLGSGTVDFEPGATYTGRSGAIAWGAQYRATLRSGTNDEGYALGDAHEATAWGQYGPAPWVAFSVRGRFRAQAPIDGIDPTIVAPAQTADPDFQGGDRFDVGVGVNFVGRAGAIKGHRLGVEALLPTYQDLNGPQLETDWTLTLGWRKTF